MHNPKRMNSVTMQASYLSPGRGGFEHDDVRDHGKIKDWLHDLGNHLCWSGHRLNLPPIQQTSRQPTMLEDWEKLYLIKKKWPIRLISCCEIPHRITIDYYGFDDSEVKCYKLQNSFIPATGSQFMTWCFATPNIIIA